MMAHGMLIPFLMVGEDADHGFVAQSRGWRPRQSHRKNGVDDFATRTAYYFTGWLVGTPTISYSRLVSSPSAHGCSFKLMHQL